MIKNYGCCDLKYAKRLNELGVKQESIWWWHIYKIDEFCVNQNYLVFGKPIFCGDNWADDYSAFTVAELGKRLPSNLVEFIHKNLDDRNRDLYFEYCNTDWALFNPNFLAKMLIWFMEKKEITI